MVALGLAGAARADVSEPAVTLRPGAGCVAALKALAREQGFGHPEEESSASSWRLVFVTTIGCDADALTFELSRARGPGRGWTSRRGDGWLAARRRVGGLALSVEVTYDVSQNELRAHRVRAAARRAFDRCF